MGLLPIQFFQPFVEPCLAFRTKGKVVIHDGANFLEGRAASQQIGVIPKQYETFLTGKSDGLACITGEQEQFPQRTDHFGHG